MMQGMRKYWMAVSLLLAVPAVAETLFPVASQSTSPSRSSSALAVSVVGASDKARDAFSRSLLQKAQFPLDLDTSTPEIVIALGDAATESACRQVRPVIGVQVSQSVLEHVRAKKCNVVAVLSQVSPATQLQLIKLLLPNEKNIGVLVSDKTRADIPRLSYLAEQLGLTLTTLILAPGEPLSRGLSKLLDEVDVLLALPDSSIFNAQNARLILMSGYRQRRPVIGPDDHWVKAGSLASAYVDADDLLETVLTLVSDYRRNKTLGGDKATPISVDVNEHVAKSLGISVSKEKLFEHLNEVKP